MTATEIREDIEQRDMQERGRRLSAYLAKQEQTLHPHFRHHLAEDVTEGSYVREVFGDQHVAMAAPDFGAFPRISQRIGAYVLAQTNAPRTRRRIGKK